MISPSRRTQFRGKALLDLPAIRHIRGSLPLGLLIIGLPACAFGAGDALPAPAEVTRRMVERSQAVARSGVTHYAYQKRSLLERLDSDGRTFQSEERLYEVTLIGGLPFNRLIKIQDRDLDPEELAKEAAKEQKFRKRFVSTDAESVAARRTGLVTPELLGRYDFRVESRVMLSNRLTLVLAFKPKSGPLPANTLLDRVLNRMAGKLWIDEAEADTARIEARLTESVHLGWFGWLGSLNQCELSLDRRRMPDGAWVNSRQVLLLDYRKVTTTVRCRITEQSSEFRLLHQ